jgi:hypothetical protein
MRLSLPVITVLLVFSLKLTDLGADSLIFSVVCPLAAFIAFIALALWFVMYFHHRGIKQTYTSSGAVSSSYDVDGGDEGDNGDASG